MNILINFSTLKGGGGQNVGLNFVIAFLNRINKNENFHFRVAKNSAVHKFLIKKGYSNTSTAPNNPIIRILSEFLFIRRLLKKHNIDIIYTYFGMGIFPKKILQVTGAADSNLYFPEIDFWRGYKSFDLLKKKIIDKYRIWGLKRANGIIFENKLLEQKCHEIFNVSAFTTCIRPSFAPSYEDKEFKSSEKIGKNVKKGLFLCGWHLNKNVMLIPEIAKKLKVLKTNFHFIITVPKDNSKEHIQFANLVDKYQVEDMISVIGEVKKEELASLYNQIDLVFLLSKLESFSNNILEAWYFKRILVISDEPWARAICGDSAIYVDRDSSEKIAYAIQDIIDNPEIYREKVKKGSSKLEEYPSTEERIEEEMIFLRYVHENS